MGQGQSGLKRETRRLAEYDPAPLNLPPLRFHETRGENIGLFSEGFVAKRVESFCKGIVFSQRPLQLGERIVIRLSGLSSQWTGVLRVGFTNVDPSTLTSLPKYACPDLTTKPGFWAKALSSTYAREAAIVQYFVTHNGTVYIGANGEDLGHFFNGVDTKKPLWAMIDLYGNCTTIELVDIRRQFHNNLHPRLTPTVVPPLPNPPLALEQNTPRTPIVPPPTSSSSRDTLPRPPSQRPILFHGNKGVNAQVGPSMNVAWRHEDEFAQGYVFSSEPIRPCKILLQILGVEPSYIGSLAAGFTNVNPSSIDPASLPEDSSALLERSREYWVLAKDIANASAPGDELKFEILREGVVTMSLNGGPSHVLMQLDLSSKLWAFWDIYGSTSKIQVRGFLPEAPSVTPSESNVLTAANPSGAVSDCTICYEKAANSVIYTCGHICMCFECAVQQWKGRGGGFCPICRQPIIDVIKTFRS